MKNCFSPARSQENCPVFSRNGSIMSLMASTWGNRSSWYTRQVRLACRKHEYRVPFGKLKLNESTVSLSIVVAADGLLSSPPDEPACTKNRFGQVGPGIEEYQLSNKKY